MESFSTYLEYDEASHHVRVVYKEGDVPESKVQHLLGYYKPEEKRKNGFPVWKLISDDKTRYLYRHKTGHWCFNENKTDAEDGIIYSQFKSNSPFHKEINNRTFWYDAQNPAWLAKSFKVLRTGK